MKISIGRTAKRELQNVLPEFSLTNGLCARKAASGYLVKEGQGSLSYELNNEMPKNRILGENIKFYEELMVEVLKKSDTINIPLQGAQLKNRGLTMQYEFLKRSLPANLPNREVRA